MNLKKKVLNSLKWTTASAVIQMIIQLFKLGIITRLLSPDDFGLMAIVLLIIGIAELFKDGGTNAAIIHHQNITTDQLSSLYWLNAIIGFILFLLIALLSPVFSSFFEAPSLLLLIPFSASTLFLQSFGQQYSVLFRKKLAFNILEKISIIIKVIDFTITIGLALLNYGIWSLIYAQILSAIASSSLFFFFGKKIYFPSFRLRIDDIKPFFSFSLYQMGGKMMNYLNSNLDKIILGKFFGMEILGFYNLAWQLIKFPLKRINPIINKINFPLFSRLQNKTNQLGSYYSFSIRSLILLIVPLYSILIIFASDIVYLLLGEGWELSASIIHVLGAVGIMKTISNPGGSILLAQGRADVGFWWNSFKVVFIALTLLVSLTFSNNVISLAYTLLIINSTMTLIWHYIIHTYGNISYEKITPTLIKSLLISGISFIIIITGFKEISFNFSIFAITIMKAVLFFILYILFIWSLEKELIIKIRSLIR